MKHSLYTIFNSSSLIPSRKALAICSFQLMPGAADHTSHRGRACPAFVRCPTPEARASRMRQLHFAGPADRQHERRLSIRSIRCLFANPRGTLANSDTYGIAGGSTWVALSVGDLAHTWRSGSALSSSCRYDECAPPDSTT